jgi:hypothetical protein
MRSRWIQTEHGAVQRCDGDKGMLLMTLPIALSVYSINCMVVGNCELLSYLLAFLTVIWVAIMVVMAFLYTFSR